MSAWWLYLLVSLYAVGFLVHCEVVSTVCEREKMRLNAWMVLMLVIWPLPAAEAAYHALKEKWT